MITIYLCFLAGGAVLPIINLIMGSLSSGFESDIDTDIDIDTDVDFDSDVSTSTDSDISNMTSDILDTGAGSMISIGLVPTSLLSLSALALIFGAVGSVMTLKDKNWILTLVIAVATGYVASVVVQTLIKSLKKIQTFNSGINENELLLYEGKVVDTILPGKLGTVSFMTLKNVLVSYPARCSDDQLKLEAGKMVKAIELKNGIFIVEPKNKYEK